MKKHWKIVLSALMLLGAITSFANLEILNGVLGLIISAALGFWWWKTKNGAPDANSKSASKEKVPGIYNREFKVAGTTFNNSDCSSRQEILKAIYQKIPPFDKDLVIELSPFALKGEPATAVLVNGLQIGSLHVEDHEFYVKAKDRSQGVINLYVNSFVPEDTKQTIYYAKVKVRFMSIEKAASELEDHKDNKPLEDYKEI